MFFFLQILKQILFFNFSKLGIWSQACPHSSYPLTPSSAGRGRWSLRWRWGQKRSRPGHKSVRTLPLCRRCETRPCRLRLLSLHTGLQDRKGEYCYIHPDKAIKKSLFFLLWDKAHGRGLFYCNHNEMRNMTVSPCSFSNYINSCQYMLKSPLRTSRSAKDNPLFNCSVT